MIQYNCNSLGTGAQTFEPDTLNLPSKTSEQKVHFWGTSIRNDQNICTNSIIYYDVTIGSNLVFKDHSIINDTTRIWDNLKNGTPAVIKWNFTLCSIDYPPNLVFASTITVRDNEVIIWSISALTEYRYPRKISPSSVVLEDGSTYGADVTNEQPVRFGSP